MNNRRFPVWAVLLGITLLPQGAPAQSIPQNACTPDIEAYCKTVEPGEGRILRCLKAHQDHLSASCQGTLDAANSKVAALRWTCGPDVIRLCTGTLASGGGEIMRCLQAHQSELSAPCTRGIQDLMGIQGPVGL